MVAEPRYCPQDKRAFHYPGVMTAKEMATAMTTAMSDVITKLMQQQTAQFAQLLQEARHTPVSSTMVDSRGMGRPPSFSGSEKE